MSTFDALAPWRPVIRCASIGLCLLLTLYCSPTHAGYATTATGNVTGGCNEGSAYSEGGLGQAFASGNVSLSGCDRDSAEASSLAHEASGTLQAHARASGGLTARANAAIQETVHLHGPKGATSVVDEYVLDIEGTTTAPFDNLATSQWSACAVIVSVNGQNSGVHNPDCFTFHDGVGGKVQGQVEVSLTVPVANGGAILQVAFHLTVVGRGDNDIFSPGHPLVTGEADFSNTVRIQQNLPEGWTFTSDSGVFLSESTLAVPEPASGALMLVGMLALVSRHLRGLQSKSIRQ